MTQASNESQVLIPSAWKSMLGTAPPCDIATAKCHLQGQCCLGFPPWVPQVQFQCKQPPLEEGEMAGQQDDQQTDIRLANCVDTLPAPPHKAATPPSQIPLKTIQPQGKPIMTRLSWRRKHFYAVDTQ